VSLVIALVGLFVGLLVGLTGVGGGSLLTPMLVLLGVPVPAAVGTDLVYNVGTKLMGTLTHWRQGGIEWRWVAALSAGGVPAAVIGSLVSQALAREAGVLGHLLGGALILAALGTGVQQVIRWRQRRSDHPDAVPPHMPVSPAALLPLGVVVGFLVGLTSIGAGALIAPALLVWSNLSGRRVVGTDVANGLLLTAAAGLAHASVGAVEWHLVLNLVLGSIPGAYLGSRLTTYVRSGPLRTVVSGLVLVSGLRLI